MTEVDAKRAEPAATESHAAHRPARRRRGWLVEGAWGIGTGLVAFALAAIFLRVWDGQRHVPLYATGDANFSLLIIKSVMHNGWVGVDHQLGFPFGSALYDDSVAFGDTFHLGVIKLLAVFSSDPVVVMNAFYLLTFFLVAVTAYGVLRDLALARPAAMASAILYSLLPYHFFRNEGHLFLSAYYSVPLGAWLVLNALRGTPMFRRRVAGGGNRLTRWVTGRTVATLFICFVVGTAEAYYAAFTLVLLVPLALLGAGTGRDVKRLTGPLVVVVLVAGFAVAAQLPQIVWHVDHGANTVVSKRLAFESEIYALKLTNLVVPLQGHPISAVSDLGAKYYEHLQAPAGEELDASLGTLLTIGFVLIVLCGFFSSAGRTFVGRWRLVADAGVAAGVAFLFATVGGTGAFVGFYLTTQLRGWNRMSTFIAFFAAIGFAALLSWGLERWVTTRRRHVAGLAVLALIIFVGYKDQVRPGFRPDYDANLVSWRSDSRYVAAIDRRLPDDAAVLQFPYIAFPEFGPLQKMVDYDELKGYLHSDRLRWSYGAVKGRKPDDWGTVAGKLPLREQIAAAVTAGFSGVSVDTYGYSDGGSAMLAQLQDAIGSPPTLVSENGRLVFFDLTRQEATADRLPPAVRAQAADTLLRPVDIQFGPGFYPPEQNATDTWSWGRGIATLAFDNEGGSARRLTLSFRLRTAGTGLHTVVLHLPGGGTRNVKVPSKAVKRVRLSTVVPSGPSRITLTTDAPADTSDGRDLHVQMLDLEGSEPALERIVAALD